jgi:hypothetical protein
MTSWIVSTGGIKVADSTQHANVRRGSSVYRVRTDALRPGIYRIQIRATAVGQAVARTVRVRIR